MPDTQKAPAEPTRAEISRRLAQLTADLRAEGASDETVARLATDTAARRMLAYERQVLLSLFGRVAA
jgi:hypothetical protein